MNLDRRAFLIPVVAGVLFWAVWTSFVWTAHWDDIRVTQTAEAAVWLTMAGVQVCLWVVLIGLNRTALRQLWSQRSRRPAFGIAAVTFEVLLVSPYLLNWPVKLLNLPLATIEMPAGPRFRAVMVAFVVAGSLAGSLLAAAGVLMRPSDPSGSLAENVKALLAQARSLRRLAWSAGVLLTVSIYATSWGQRALAAGAKQGTLQPAGYTETVVVAYGVYLSFLLVMAVLPSFIRFHERAVTLLEELAPVVQESGATGNLEARKAWEATLGLTAQDGVQAAALFLAPTITAVLSVASGR
jgi:hypothetical protein